MIEDPADLIRLVADPIRLNLLGRAADGSVDIEETATAFDVPKRKVIEAIGKLRAAGLMDDELRLFPERLRMIAAKLPSAPLVP